MRDEEGMLPTSIVLCLRKPHTANFESAVEANGSGETGLLRIAADVPLWVVDGQHRLYGLERALTHDKAKWLADYPLPVVIVEGVDAYEEMRYFHVINTRHKGVPTDVVDRHLLSMREEEGAGAAGAPGRARLPARPRHDAHGPAEQQQGEPVAGHDPDARRAAASRAPDETAQHGLFTRPRR